MIATSSPHALLRSALLLQLTMAQRVACTAEGGAIVADDDNPAKSNSSIVEYTSCAILVHVPHLTPKGLAAAATPRPSAHHEASSKSARLLDGDGDSACLGRGPLRAVQCLRDMACRVCVYKTTTPAPGGAPAVRGPANPGASAVHHYGPGTVWTPCGGAHIVC